MAVEAHHLSQFPPPLIQNRDSIYITAQNANLCDPQMSFSISDNLIPFYDYPISDPFSAAMTTNADSVQTCNLSTPQKKLTGFNNPFLWEDQTCTISPHLPSSFLGEDFFLQIQHQQEEIDRLVAFHMEKVRMDLAETRRLQRKRILAAVEEGITKRLKQKEEEIEKIGRLNCVLEERVRNLCAENQQLRALAMLKEATANVLRSDLNQVLAKVSNEQRGASTESCCDSNEGDEIWKEKMKSCRSCRKEEACVLFLPCRHLCLCTKCSSRLDLCPVCKTSKSASVHVNVS